MSLAILARKHYAKKKASKGNCFNTAMTNRGTVRRTIRKAKNCCSKVPIVNNSSCACDVDTVTGCKYNGCMSRPLQQKSYKNYLKQLTNNCNTIKCNPDQSSSEKLELKKAFIVKDLSYNYTAQCLSCKKNCSSNKANKTLCNAFPKTNACNINTQTCNAKAIMTKLHVKTKWCNTTVKDLGMRGAEERLAALKGKVLSCRKADGSSMNNRCECISTKKKCA